MAGISSKAAGGLENKKKYNGIEFDNDLDINIYEAFYRNLDPQIGRWWQIDPLFEAGINPAIKDDDEKGLESLTPYNSMGNNPVKYSDPKGDLFGFDNLVGAAIGAAIDYGSQVVSNYADGKSLKESFTDVDGASIATSAAIGFVTSGVANVAGKVFTKAGSVVATKLEPVVAKLVLSNTVKQGAAVIEKQLAKGGMSSLKGVLDAVGKTTKEASSFFGWGNATKITKGIGDFSKKDLLANGWTKENLVALARGYNDQIVKAATAGGSNPAALVRRDQVMQIVKTYFGK
jgi:RHS repeat-associated protein